MPKLYLTTCFHGNLGYSSIPESKYGEVIDRCYWPFISLAEGSDIRLGFEFPAKTLEIIKKLDPSLIAKLRELIKEERIEFIGSGYVQAVFPLIPFRVNLKNLELGDQIYQRLLGVKPKTALVNEQAYSKGLIRLYKEAGYKTIIIDWLNSLKTNPRLKECKFSAARIKGVGKESISVIWNNSVLFQKLQRYVYGEIGLAEYLTFVRANYSARQDRVLMIYGSDMEVFDFRPRDPETLHSGRITEPEIKRIGEAFKGLKDFKEIRFTLPGKAVTKNYIGKTYEIGSPECPIITKKQEKYDVIRWAVCGKNNYISNTLCYRAYKLLEKKYGRQKNRWKSLVEFWDSDYRTYTERKRWRGFRSRLNEFIKELEPRRSLQVPTPRVSGRSSLKKLHIRDNTIETDSVLLGLSDKKGATIRELVFKGVSDKPLIRTIPQGYFDDISYAVDLFSGHTIILDENRQKTDLSKTEIQGAEMEDKIWVGCQNYIEDLGRVSKDYYVYKDLARVDLVIALKLSKKIRPIFVRSGIITINPEAFDRDSLYYSARNGGPDKEVYYLKNSFDQASPTDLRISAKHCLGATAEELEIGDKKIRLVIKTDKSQTYSVPLIKFEKLNETFVLRIFNSIIEQDETSDTFLTGERKIAFTYQGTVSPSPNPLSYMRLQRQPLIFPNGYPRDVRRRTEDGKLQNF